MYPLFGKEIFSAFFISYINYYYFSFELLEILSINGFKVQSLKKNPG
jgi:hypothetical protein